MSYRDKPREDREMHDATCDNCKKETQVPFVPDPNRSVYCQDCYREIRNQNRR